MPVRACVSRAGGRAAGRRVPLPRRYRKDGHGTTTARISPETRNRLDGTKRPRQQRTITVTGLSYSSSISKSIEPHHSPHHSHRTAPRLYRTEVTTACHPLACPLARNVRVNECIGVEIKYRQHAVRALE